MIWLFDLQRKTCTRRSSVLGHFKHISVCMFWVCNQLSNTFSCLCQILFIWLNKLIIVWFCWCWNLLMEYYFHNYLRQEKSESENESSINRQQKILFYLTNIHVYLFFTLMISPSISYLLRTRIHLLLHIYISLNGSRLLEITLI